MLCANVSRIHVSANLIDNVLCGHVQLAGNSRQLLLLFKRCHGDSITERSMQRGHDLSILSKNLGAMRAHNDAVGPVGRWARNPLVAMEAMPLAS